MQEFCKGVVIVDIPNVKLKQGKSENSVRNILRVLSEMELKGKSLQEIQKELKQKISDMAVVGLALSNLKKSESTAEYSWKINIQVL